MKARKASTIVSAMSENELGFYEGALATLAIMNLHDDDVIFAEAVQTLGVRHLVAVAIVNDDTEMSRLNDHGYSKRKSGYEDRFVK